MSAGKLICNPVKEDHENEKYISGNINADEKINLFAITKDGRLLVGKYSLNDLTALGAQEVLSFGPSLIINEKKSKLLEDEKKAFRLDQQLGKEKMEP